ncbi:DUF3833 domain-containing protein [Ruegeria sp. HKCCA5426]|uniref:DUF3833 domain-containing protein n=1 Tax=Ruegeria sp. HKCCA5426 TaxID=2682985 RepID=UPI001488BC86|nr:DUF3833 domain-containing protein [Ruegeria sp. HKCCA5426]
MNWRRFLIWAIAIVGVTILASCSAKPRVPKTFLSDRQLNLEEFFEGKTVAYGQFQDILGNVPRRFTVEIEGTWDGETLTLVEDFVYDDGAKEQRIWTLTKTGEDTWTGTAPGVLGTASGVERGDTFNWKYKIDLPVKDGTMRVNFDDWMWLLSDYRLLNRAYVSRYGVRLGEVILFFEKK